MNRLNLIMLLFFFILVAEPCMSSCVNRAKSSSPEVQAHEITKATRQQKPGTNYIAVAVTRLLSVKPLPVLKRVQQDKLCKEIYKILYSHALDKPKPITTSNEKYTTGLGKYLKSKTDGSWHKRYGLTGRAKGPLRRFYFNVVPDHALELTNYLTMELNKRNLHFSFKIPIKLSSIARRHAGVLYVNRNDYHTAKTVVLKFAHRNPSAFASSIPLFTKRISKGIASADDIDRKNTPPTRSRHSFGTLRSDIICEVVINASQSTSQQKITELVRRRFLHYGLNPNQPWLQQATAVDDL